MGALIDINTNGLAKLVELVFNVTGLSASGAKKNTDAKIYDMFETAKAEIEINRMKQNSANPLERFVATKELRKMNNILQVSEKAVHEFVENEQVSSEVVYPDWSARFFNIIEDVSDDEMQNLWAKILAGEIKHPKSFSLRTLDVLRNLSKEEAETFMRNAPYSIDGSHLCAENNFISISDYLLLVDAGLINSEELAIDFTPSDEGVFDLVTGNRVIRIKGDKDRIKRMGLKIYTYTKAGKELLKLTTFQPNENLLEYIVTIFKQMDAEKITEHLVIEVNGEPNNIDDDPLKVYLDNSSLCS